MGSSIYKEVLKTNAEIYGKYAEEYRERTKNGHENYLSGFINKFLKALKGRKIFDLGCGPGRDLEFFIKEGYEATGVDCSAGMIDLCRQKNLPVIKNDFLSVEFEPHSVDGIWAYTSHTVIPKREFELLIQKYSEALKCDDGVLALGMIEGDFEGWKSDQKYDGAKRFVARYSCEELETLLKKYFGTVTIERVAVGSKVYLHCLCRNTGKADRKATAQAAENLFNAFSDEYLKNTQGGIKLLERDRSRFAELILSNGKLGKKILDIGCGPGRDLRLLSDKGFEVTGFDISEANVEHCRAQGLNAVRGDMYFLQNYFKPNSFDAVWCNCSVTNWILKDELPAVLHSIKSIVKEGGIIFIGSVLGNFSGWEIDQKYDRMKRYNNHWREEELRTQLSMLGELLYENKLTNTGKKDYLNLVYANEK